MVESDALFELQQDPADTATFAGLARLPLPELMAPDWAAALQGVEAQLRKVLGFLAAEEAQGHQLLPSPSNVLRTFRQPLADVRVLIVGQDPYPTPGHAVGLSFSVDPHVRPLPRSLVNIYRELESDLGVPPRVHGDLSAWTEQGVLLLNRVLTVRAGAAGSHRGKGWEEITTAAVTALASRTAPDGSRTPLVAVLWGKEAEGVRALLDGAPAVTSPHPSPLSASRGFFGSRPFSRANQLLREQGAPDVTWELPPLP
ncbi:uracil-DNA glycosylase [Pseudarthrobacter sp. C4D7]|uniref:uracil-DNA glycosylase n=1 Tax=Pseudarthrobacter sp. C4D7 TaxID=2735268 RepID=UPI001585A9B3|nr:uracil-DNA glycosylase [Pseudarthrobacter sp. C4D7]NUT71216.1 uracil-DNA glycosylase [Pseudarthrobacter sp. C4D7]